VSLQAFAKVLTSSRQGLLRTITTESEAPVAKAMSNWTRPGRMARLDAGFDAPLTALDEDADQKAHLD